ncbi:MAG: bifunctional UDP-N-acetylglucosamine pyrophosphorylase / Glucosamine-1-phosphate N-acetyltransferase [Parcubacteria group bacterium Gr01-1014_106]|nr:MAG: bifunctional UDP-N-acetylglucosamine pyrophosphorylase / Glucosamine-1-phosphate N-acetyltransferase [Parcubacteria group bacterium Gr01-1014_106]
MQAVILAAGLGKRLRPITETVPKPLVPVAGKPVVEYTIGHLPTEVDEIIFVVGYKGHMLRERFGDSTAGRSVRYVEQGEPLGTGHAVRQAKPLVRGNFLLLYGDDIYGADGLQRLVKHDCGLLVRRVDNPQNFGVVVTDEHGCVARLVEKPKEFVSDLSWVGAGVFPETFLDIETPLSQRGEYEATDMFNVLIQQGTRIYTEVADLWLPGNTHEEVQHAAEELQAVKHGT